MKKTTYIISAVLMLLVASCSKVDIYDVPAETLNGTLADAAGNPFISEQPNGFKIKLIEQGSTTPRDFWGMADGKFNNTKIFKGSYKIVPTDGAFFPVDTVQQEINGVTTINFQITPYLTINAFIIQNGPDLKATYRIRQATGAGKIKNARLLVNKWNPNVGMNYSDKSIMRELSSVSDANIVQTDYTDQISGYLQSGVTYYARVAVLSDNSMGKYNFSAVQKIIVP